MKPRHLTPSVQRFLPLLAAADTAGLLALFAGGQPVVDDPRFGRVASQPDLERYVAESARWLQARQARVEHLAAILTETASVSEDVLHLAPAAAGAPAIALPAAVAADHADAGHLRAVRVYHSLWPLSGKHQVRPPLLPKDERAVLHDVVARYHRALHDGEAEVIPTLFEPDGIAREPSGGDFVYVGRSKLKTFYHALLAKGGIHLDHCRVVDDGVRCALEYNAVAWGGTVLPPQAGLAVYERGPTRLLAAARIYDDVDPPL